MIGSRKVVLTMVFAFLAATFASASDIYVAQKATGSDSGADCADAHSAAWFNNSGNWGSGVGKIGPGTTVHLCGTFTGAANSTMLTIQGDGTSGNPVIIRFEDGADLNAPYWSANGAITCSGHNYVTIDGNNTGTIENTNNGDAFANQQSSKGIYFSNCSNVDVKNFTGSGSIRNIYQRDTSHSSNGINTHAVFFDTGCDHIKVDNNTIYMSRNLIFVAYSTVTDVQVFNNTLDHSSWMIVMGDNNNNSFASGIVVHNNNLGPHFDEWQDFAQTMHADGIMIFAANSGSSATAQIYNNYAHGDMCTSRGLNCTGYIYVQGNQSTYIFNNVVVAETGSNEGNIVVRGNSPGPAPTNNRIYNNTLIGNGGVVGIKNGGGLAGSGLVFENNVFANLAIAMTFGPNNLSSLSTSRYNDFYNVTKIAATNVDPGPEHDFTTLANWQAQGFDTNSSSGNPNLDTTYVPQKGSAAIGLATNLTALGIAPLASDKAGLARAASGAWDAGAYQDPPGNSLAPPTNLSAGVH